MCGKRFPTYKVKSNDTGEVFDLSVRLGERPSGRVFRRKVRRDDYGAAARGDPAAGFVGRTATYWTDRAAGANRNVKHKECLDVRARRIKVLQADKRKQEHTIAESTRYRKARRCGKR